MKKILSILLFFISLNVFGQNVEVSGTYVAGAAPLFTIKNITTQALNVNSELQFMNGTRFTGAIKTIGVTGTSAKLSLFTYSNGTYSNLRERFTINDNGSFLLTPDVGTFTIAPSTIGAGNDFSFIGSNALTSGTNINAGNLILSSGSSQGTGYGRIVFKVAKVGLTGTSTNTPVEVFSIGGVTNNISITDASFNLSHASPTPNDGMSSQVTGASVAAFALWGRNSCPTSNGTGFGNATANVAVSGQMETDKTYSFGLHAMVSPCTNITPVNNCAGVYGVYTDYATIAHARGALGFKDVNDNYIGVWGDGDTYAAKFDFDILFGNGSGLDDHMHPGTTNFGYIGTASLYYYYMKSTNFITASKKELKRNINYVENDVLSYIINDIKNIKPALYKYYDETEQIEKGNESKYRPNFHLGVIVEESPDYIQDNEFSGIDIYGMATLGVVGAKYSIEEVDKLKEEILYLKNIIQILCEKSGVNMNTIQVTKKVKQTYIPPIEGLKVNQDKKIKIIRTDMRKKVFENKIKTQ